MDKGTLYLSYYGNYRNFPKEFLLVPVSRTLPREMDYYYYARDLAPSEELKNAYKYEGLGWEEFSLRFIKELDSRDGVARDVSVIEKFLDEGKDVCLLCYEKEGNCHRYILGELFKGNYEVFNLIGDKKEIFKE